MAEKQAKQMEHVERHREELTAAVVELIRLSHKDSPPETKRRVVKGVLFYIDRIIWDDLREAMWSSYVKEIVRLLVATSFPFVDWDAVKERLLEDEAWGAVCEGIDAEEPDDGSSWRPRDVEHWGRKSE
jgi:hypothetical protein